MGKLIRPKHSLHTIFRIARFSLILLVELHPPIDHHDLVQQNANIHSRGRRNRTGSHMVVCECGVLWAGLRDTQSRVMCFDNTQHTLYICPLCVAPCLKFAAATCNAIYSTQIEQDWNGVTRQSRYSICRTNIYCNVTTQMQSRNASPSCEVK